MWGPAAAAAAKLSRSWFSCIPPGDDDDTRHSKKNLFLPLSLSTRVVYSTSECTCTLDCLGERETEKWNRRWDDWAQRKPNPQQTHTQLGFARLRLIRSLPLPTERRVCLHHNTRINISFVLWELYLSVCPWRKIGFLFRFEKIFFENAAPTSLWLRPKKLRLTSYKMCVCV